MLYETKNSLGDELLKTETKQSAFKTLQQKYNLTKSYIYNLYEKNK